MAVQYYQILGLNKYRLMLPQQLVNTTVLLAPKVQGVPCARGLGFVDLDLECSTTLLGQ